MDLTKFNKHVGSYFIKPSADDFAALVRYSVTGEWFGHATFEALAAANEDPRAKAFWLKLAALERITMRKLESLVARHEIALPDQSSFLALGDLTATQFADKPLDAYFAWVSPAVDPATTVFRQLLSLCDNEEDRETCIQLVMHEVAISLCCQLFSQGLDAASVPIDDHLKRYSDNALGPDGTHLG